MGKKKGNKMEYDNVYPPLNMKEQKEPKVEPAQNKITPNEPKTKISAIQEYLTHLQNLKSLIIPARDRRPLDDDACARLTRELYTRFNISVKTKQNSLGSLQIEPEGLTKITDPLTNFILHESFKKQSQKVLVCPEKVLRKLMDRKYLDSFTHNRFVHFRADFGKEKLYIDGGYESVHLGTEDAQTFIAAHTNTVNISLEIAGIYQDFIRNSDEMKNLVKSSKYCFVNYRTPEFDKITINGSAKFGNDVKEIITKIYEKLCSEFVSYAAHVTNIQLREFINLVPKNIIESKRVTHASVNKPINSLNPQNFTLNHDKPDDSRTLPIVTDDKNTKNNTSRVSTKNSDNKNNSRALPIKSDNKNNINNLTQNDDFSTNSDDFDNFDDKHTVIICGLKESVEELKKILDETIAKNTESFTNCPYWLAKNLIELNDFQKIFYQKFKEINLVIHPKEEKIAFRAHAQIIPEIKKSITAILEDLKKLWSYRMLEITDDVFKVHDQKDLDRIRAIEAESCAKIFVDTSLKNLSIFKTESGEKSGEISSLTGKSQSSNQKSNSSSNLNKKSNSNLNTSPASSTSSNSNINLNSKDNVKDKNSRLPSPASQCSSSSLSSNYVIEPPKYLIMIVGDPEHVKIGYAKLLELKAFYESFQSKTITISNHLHRYIIGAKGKTLNDLISNHGKNCAISLGKHTHNLDECVIKGPKDEIETLETAIMKKVAEFDEMHYRLVVPVPKKFAPTINTEKSKLLSALRKVCQYESINFPTATLFEISIVGRKDAILKAKIAIDNFIQEIIKSITKTIPVPAKLIPVFTDCRDSILKAISDDAGGAVSIKLPENLKNDQISIFGPEKSVDFTISIINKLSALNNEDISFDIVKVQSVHTQALQGLIFKIIENSGVKVYFPSPNKKSDEDKILIFGKASGVSNVKKSIEEAIINIKNTVEEVINIKADYKKEFLKKRGEEETLVQKLSAEHGGVRIVLGERAGNSPSITVTLKGNNIHVQNVIQVINKLCSEFDRRSEQKISFVTKNLHKILTKCRNLLKNTMNQYNVVLSISESYYEAIKSQKFDGYCEITIRGLPEDISKAYDYISGWEIITKSYQCPVYIQKNIFSFKSEHYPHIVKNCMVELELGYKKDPVVDEILITGLESNIALAIEYLDKEIENDFEHRLYVPEKYFRRLIGKNGSQIQKFNQENNVTLSIPSRSVEIEEIVIYGNKKDCLKAAEKLVEMIEKWDSMITKDFQIDARFKFQICGPKNENIRKIAKAHNVIINVVQSTNKADKYRTIQVSGTPQEIESFIGEIKKTVDVLNEEIEDDYRYEAQHEMPYQIDISSINVADHISQKTQKESKKQKISAHRSNKIDNLNHAISTNIDSKIQIAADNQ